MIEQAYRNARQVAGASLPASRPQLLRGSPTGPRRAVLRYRGECGRTRPEFSADIRPRSKSV